MLFVSPTPTVCSLPVLAKTPNISTTLPVFSNILAMSVIKLNRNYVILVVSSLLASFFLSLPYVSADVDRFSHRAVGKHDGANVRVVKQGVASSLLQAPFRTACERLLEPRAGAKCEWCGCVFSSGSGTASLLYTYFL